MTTIAFDGKTLAGDRLSSIFRGDVQKVFRLKDGSLFGASGAVQDACAVLRWLDDGGEKPKVDENFHAIHVSEGRLVVYENALVPMRYSRSQFAVGSGRDFAMAAMHLGRTAREAIAVAMVFDLNTGGTIDEVRETEGDA